MYYFRTGRLGSALLLSILCAFLLYGTGSAHKNTFNSYTVSNHLTTKQGNNVSGHNAVSRQMNRDINSDEIVKAHNVYREALGLNPLTWSDSLAQSAQQWANHLAEIHEIVHSDNNSYGENIWGGTTGVLSFTQMVDSWGDEKNDYIPGSTFPNVSTTGNWQDVGHYTQMIWRNTTEVGCGLMNDDQNDFLVCQYNPPGNDNGQNVF